MLCAIGPLCENVTLSTKPEVHIVPQRRHSVGHRQHVQKFGVIRPYGFGVARAKRQQTNKRILITILDTPPRGEFSRFRTGWLHVVVSSVLAL